MITEIIVEQQRLDLFEDIGAELNYAIDDIKDFSSRNTSYSKTINVPGNANNNQIFGHIYNLNSSNNYGNNKPSVTNIGYNFDPTRQANCKIFVNKIQVFKGVLRLLEITRKNGVIEYQCVVFGELGGFASAIGNILLEDMNNFNQYDTVWNETNVVNSWSASGVASGTGVVFPLIDYGLCSNPAYYTGTDWHLNAFRPAFFVHEIIDRIILNSKYTYTSAFSDTPFFKSLIIPNNKAELEQLTNELLKVSTNSCLDSGSNTGGSGTFTFPIISNLVLFTNNTNTNFLFDSTNTATLGKVRLSGSVVLSRPGNFTLILYQGATILYQETFYPTTDFLIVDIYQEIPITLNPNQDLSVIAQFSTNETYVSLCPSLNLEFIADYPKVAKATRSVKISMKNSLPKGIQQKDFFASICRMFNLYVFEDPTKSNHLLIEPYVDFYRTDAGFLKISDLGELLLHGESGDATGLLLLSDPVADSVDWSNKVDYSKEMSIKPMSEYNSRYYDYLYEPDDDYYNDVYNNKYNESYGDRKEDTGNPFATDRTKVNLKFSASVLSIDGSDTKLKSNLFKQTNGIQERKDNNIRIMFYKKSTTASWAIKQESSTGSGVLVGSLTNYGYAGHLDDPIQPLADLNFGVPKEVYFKLSNTYPSENLFNTWWDSYVAEIINRDSKLLSCYLYLTIQDINNLDFSQLIYIDGALFRLNKIVDFNGSIPQTTKVELLKVIELTYG